MDEDSVKLQNALAAISAENQAFRHTEAKLLQEIAALRKSLTEVSIDVGAQTRLLADCASQSLSAAADTLAAARAAGDPAVVGKAEIAERLAKQADDIAATLMAYMTYIGRTIAGNAPTASGRIPGGLT